MDYQYNINQISSKCKVSLQSIYSLIKKNKAFITENSIRKQRKIYYNQAAMDFFISYYAPDTNTEKKIPDEIVNIDAAEKQTENSPFQSGQPENPPLESGQPDTIESQLNALQSKIDALQAEIDALKTQLKEKEEERKELIQQNGALILTISQLQQEKMRLLPAPKKSFAETLKNILKGKS